MLQNVYGDRNQNGAYVKKNNSNLIYQGSFARKHLI